MPDVWTTNPHKLRNYLKESGSTCGVEPRVLEGRDPAWTCTYDSKGWLRDVYIHSIHEVQAHSVFLAPVLLMFIGGIFLGLLWGKRFWYEPPPPPSPAEDV